jgi:hypothetical protein
MRAATWGKRRPRYRRSEMAAICDTYQPRCAKASGNFVGDSPPNLPIRDFRR